MVFKGTFATAKRESVLNSLQQALAQGNEDARGRLDTLEAGAKPMSRNEHEAQAALLVRCVELTFL